MGTQITARSIQHCTPGCKRVLALFPRSRSRFSPVPPTYGIIMVQPRNEEKQRMFRFLTAGESHGPQLTMILEGLPAGMPLLHAHLAGDLKRRQGGYGRG